MSNRWAETIPRGTAVGASATVSVAVHALLIGAAIVGTATGELAARREIPEVFVRFLAPPDRRGGQEARREQLRFVVLGEPAVPVRGARLLPVDEVTPAPHKKISGLELQTVEAAPALVGQDSVFTLIEVDSAATRYPWSAAPAYPPAMLEARREGSVKAQWVVDEAGYADTSSLKLLDWTTEEFAKAVRDALPYMRFSPAKVGDKAVKQMVQQEFMFRISSVVTGVAKKPEP